MKKSVRQKIKKIRNVRLKATGGGADASLPARSGTSGHSSGADKPEKNRSSSDLFAFDAKSVAQLAVGSSVVIATLLSLPDAVALIPGATSLVSWTLRLIGNWVICAVLWFVGFSALVHCLRLISRGVIASSKGVKLSRFDRLINWIDIQAVSLEPNAFFTRIFSLKVPARKLTIYFRLTAKNKLLANMLFPNFVPSFFFNKETFDALVRKVFDQSGILPAAKLPQELEHNYEVLAYRPEQIVAVRTTSKWLARQRIIVSFIVAISLILFLGRKGVVYYCYNSGQKDYREGRLDKAREYYELATKFDPTFGAAWNGLGQCEFHLAETNLTDFDRARKDWKVALLCKPDYVEPKLNLARLALYQRKFAEAADHIEHATFFDPQNTLALLEKAELDIRRGKPVEGLKTARLVVAQTEGAAKHVAGQVEFAFLAHCLIAQARLDMGDLAGADNELKQFSNDPADYQYGQNITYLYLVRSRILAAQKNYQQAEKLALAAVRRQPRNEEALAQAAIVEVDLGHYDLADKYLADARALLVPDPWLSIIYGRQAIKQNKIDSAVSAYNDALIVPDDNQDAFALATVNSEVEPIHPAPLKPVDDPVVAEAIKSENLANDAKLNDIKTDAKKRAEKINPEVFKYPAHP